MRAISLYSVVIFNFAPHSVRYVSWGLCVHVGFQALCRRLASSTSLVPAVIHACDSSAELGFRHYQSKPGPHAMSCLLQEQECTSLRIISGWMRLRILQTYQLRFEIDPRDSHRSAFLPGGAQRQAGRCQVCELRERFRVWVVGEVQEEPSRSFRVGAEGLGTCTIQYYSTLPTI